MRLPVNNSLAILLITSAYIVIELIFNVRLVDVASSKPSKLEIANLELFGGLVSALGASIICWRLACTLKKIDGINSIKYLILCSGLVGPIVFFGQKVIVDHYASASSPENMRRAVVSTIMAKAIQGCVVEIKGMNSECSQHKAPEWKTFNSLLTSLSFISGSLLASFESKMPNVISRLVEVDMGNPDEIYRDVYVNNVNKLRELYNTKYRDASKQMGELTDNDYNPEEAWLEYLREINSRPFTSESATDIQRNAVISALRSRGINVPDSWSLNDKQGFINALPQNQIKLRFRESANDLLGGITTIEPGLDWTDFSRHPDVQRYIKSKIQTSAGFVTIPSGLIDLNADRVKFNSAFLNNSLQTESSRLLTKLSLSESSYSQNGVNYQDGVDAMRAVIVPPIAMGFSLFFGIINLIALITQLLPFSRVGQAGTRLILFLAVLVGPFAFENLVTSSSAYKTMEIAIEKQVPVASIGLSWVIRAEPLFYSIFGSVNSLIKSLI